MIEYKTRLYHCHKVKRNVKILEDYETIYGMRRLTKCTCPYYKTNGKVKCNGVNDHGFTCGYANYNINNEIQ